MCIYKYTVYSSLAASLASIAARAAASSSSKATRLTPPSNSASGACEIPQGGKERREGGAKQMGHADL